MYCQKLYCPRVSRIDINRFSALGGENCPVDLFCTEEEVLDLICGIDPTKSSEPDQISARMLRATAGPAVYCIPIRTALDQGIMSSYMHHCPWQ